MSDVPRDRQEGIQGNQRGRQKGMEVQGRNRRQFTEGLRQII